MNWLDEVKWDAQGLVAAVAQDASSGRVLTVAWMNREALATTVAEQRAVYWSRSRRKLWRRCVASRRGQAWRWRRAWPGPRMRRPPKRGSARG
jgi:phosphoribosyl-AMP cyclohydrolase